MCGCGVFCVVGFLVCLGVVCWFWVVFWGLFGCGVGVVWFGGCWFLLVVGVGVVGSSIIHFAVLEFGFLVIFWLWVDFGKFYMLILRITV